MNIYRQINVRAPAVQKDLLYCLHLKAVKVVILLSLNHTAEDRNNGFQ